MNRFPAEFTRVLAVDVASRGLAFALLEGPLTIIDWGFHNNVHDDRDARCLAQLLSMFIKFRPDVLVIEDFRHTKRRSGRVRRLTNSFAAAAEEHRIGCDRVPWKEVRADFPTCRNKYEIAHVLAERFPDIKHVCPPMRKSWETEDPRFNIFDALGLATTLMARAKKNGNGRRSATGEDRAAS